MRVSYYPQFVRQFKRLKKELQDEVVEKVELFKKDHKSRVLKTHRLHGKLKGLWAFSINYSHRVVFEIIDKEAVLLEIGDHDIYK